MSIATKKGIEITRPRLDGSFYELDDKFRDKILTKAINLSRAANHCALKPSANARSLAEMQWYAREGHLKLMYEQYSKFGKEY